MPGALMMLAKANDFRFLFTGDYTYWDVTPFAGTRRFLDQVSRPIDFLLIDGTSAWEDFGDPQQQIDNLILFMEQKADYGDNSLIGADPSSLAITFMLTFWRFFRKLQLREDFKKRDPEGYKKVCSLNNKKHVEKEKRENLPAFRKKRSIIINRYRNKNREKFFVGIRIA